MSCITSLINVNLTVFIHLLSINIHTYIYIQGNIKHKCVGRVSHVFVFWIISNVTAKYFKAPYYWSPCDGVFPSQMQKGFPCHDIILVIPHRESQHYCTRVDGEFLHKGHEIRRRFHMITSSWCYHVFSIPVSCPAPADLSWTPLFVCW